MKHINQSTTKEHSLFMMHMI